MLSRSFDKMLFKNVWNRPFCDLFLPSTTTKPSLFSGKCTAISQSCHDASSWCQDATHNTKKSDAFRRIQAKLAMQLMQVLPPPTCLKNCMYVDKQNLLAVEILLYKHALPQAPAK